MSCVTGGTIRKGTTFDTPFETGCVAAGSPDEDGSFDGYDGEGVLCAFTVIPGGMPLTVTSQPETVA